MHPVPRLVCILLAAIVAGFAWVTVAHAMPADDIYIPLLAGPGPESEPLHVTPQRDAGRAATSVIPLAGGQVQATGADGARFTLTIPPGALLQTTTVTLTPVSQIAGLPADRLAAAVELEAESPELFEAASLQIEPAQAIPVDTEYPFAYYPGGQDFHPYPILPYREELIFPIGRLEGGYGIAQQSDQARQSSQVAIASPSAPAFQPADPEARLRAQIAELIQQERSRVLQGEEPDPTFWGKVRDLALEYYNQVIQPILQPSREDCAFAEANLWKAISWLRTVQLLFGETNEPDADPDFAAAADAIIDTLLAAIQNCYRKAAEPCMDWENVEQVREVLRHYRTLALLEAEETVIAPQDLPECLVVDVILQDGSFLFAYPRDDEHGWEGTVRFRFVDDTVSSVGFYNPFRRTPLPNTTDPTAVVSVTAKIDDVWQPVGPAQRFFCRDKKAERVQELSISISLVDGEPAAPPQLYADNIGCWRWTGAIEYDADYTNLSPFVPVYYKHTAANVTFELDTTGVAYVPFFQNGEIYVSPREYILLPAGTVNYDEKYQVVDDKGNTTCLKTLTLNLTDLTGLPNPDWPALYISNAGFGAPRKVQNSLGSELHVDAPYTVEGSCAPDTLKLISLLVNGDISADGKHIYINETGALGEHTGTFRHLVDLQALRE